MKKISLTIATLGLTLMGCNTTVTSPVAVVSKGIKGGVMKGTTTSSANGGSFNVSNGILSCSGNFNPFDRSPTISIPVICSDGRRGIIISTRGMNGMSGGGTFTLDDGTSGNFIFGDGANQL